MCRHEGVRTSLLLDKSGGEDQETQYSYPDDDYPDTGVNEVRVDHQDESGQQELVVGLLLAIYEKGRPEQSEEEGGHPVGKVDTSRFLS